MLPNPIAGHHLLLANLLNLNSTSDTDGPTRKQNVSSRAHKRWVVMAPKVVREPRCKCNCSEELGQLADSLEKIKSFLRANYCDHCKKAGHTRTTCRKRRQPPTFEFDLDSLSPSPSQRLSYVLLSHFTFPLKHFHGNV